MPSRILFVRLRVVSLTLALCALSGALSVVRTQTPPVPPVSVKVSAGALHSLALDATSRIWSWGDNTGGQLGDGTTTTRLAPTLVTGATGVFTAVSAGGTHSLARRSDGRVVAWGANVNGEVGDGTTTQRRSPVVLSGITDAVAVAAGANHSLALRSTGQVVAWGLNSEGQLGDNTRTRRLSPVAVSGLSNVVAIAAGGLHSLALTADGRVFAWGDGAAGALGLNNTSDRLVPTQITSLTGMIAISAGAAHSAAVTSSGSLRTWGNNATFQLGDGTQTTRLVPVTVAGLTGVTGVSAGAGHTLAMTSTQVLFGWGNNAGSQLGDGSIISRPTPTVITPPAAVTAIAAGGVHSLVLATDASVWAAGTNLAGQVGDGSTTTAPRFAPISGPGQTWGVYPPVLAPSGGTFGAPQPVTASTSTASATIRYTTSGVDPSSTDPVFPGAGLTISTPTTLKVRAFRTGMTQSAVTTGVYAFAVSPPLPTPGGGAYTAPQTVSLSTTTPGALITYTLDNSDPTEASTAYTAPFLIGVSSTLKARAFRAGWQPSSITSFVYTFNFGTLATPTATPGGGTYATPQTVTLSAEAGATIRYTLGGADPTAASPVYGAPIPIPSTTTLKARAFRQDWTPSAILAATYVINATSEPLPPDPSTVATPINPTTITDFAQANAFLYAGVDPIQRGATASAFEADRLAVVRGRVLDRAGQSLSGARVTILDGPEFGHTLSRADGFYDMAVNGGGDVVVEIERDGYLPVQRHVSTSWHGFERVDDVRMIQLDPVATTVRFDGGASLQAARGSIETDDSGQRRATVIVPDGGVHANLELPDGTVLPDQAQLTLRATEYTVGAGGPQAMPAALPSTSGYTYAVELSADEALQVGARVTFDPALVLYLENFIGIPVGKAVPAGAYDREKAGWVPERNGRVIRVLAPDNTGAANLDIDGSGAAASAAALAALGVTAGERRQLATMYATGQTLWRVPVPHFSAWDCNFPVGPDDMVAPNVPAPTTDVETENPTCQSGSVIECENQALGERLPITGTPFSLNYRSSRQPGRTSSRALTVTARVGTAPPSMNRIEVRVLIGGQLLVQELAPDGPQAIDVLWDGRDAYGRPWLGQQRAKVEVRHLYKGVYREPTEEEKAFARRGGLQFGTPTPRGEVYVSSEFHVFVGGTDAAGTGAAGLGGWTLDVHHAYDPATSTLTYGDGSRRTAPILVAHTAAGGGTLALTTTPQPATSVALPPALSALTPTPDGSLYAQAPNASQVLRLFPDGQIAEQPLPAVPSGYRRSAIGRTSAGDLLVGEMTLLQSVFNGCGNGAYQAARFFAVRPDGTQVNDSGAAVILPNAVCQTAGIKLAAGQGPNVIGAFGPYLYEFQPGATVRLATTGSPTDFASAISALWTDPDGTIYYAANSRVTAIDVAGKATTIAGTGTFGSSGDGGPAANAQLGLVRGIVRDAGGNLLLNDFGSFVRIRRITPDGVIQTIAGAGADGSIGEGGPAARVSLNGGGLAIDARGALLVSDTLEESGEGRLRRLEPALSTALGGTIQIASEDGSAVYEFDPSGRHLRTRDSLLGIVLLSFAYDPADRLASITDADGQVTTVERLPNGVPSAIVGPFGQRTTLTLSPDGFLETAADPAGGTTRLTYSGGDGLLTAMRTPRGDDYTFGYDSLGRLIEDADPAGGVQTLSRLADGLHATVTVAHNAGYARAHEVTRLVGGDEQRRTREADGTEAVTSILATGIRDTLTAEGIRQTIQQSPDPRFGMQASIAGANTISTPGGLTLQALSTREASLTDPQNLLTLTSETRTTVINGRTWRQVFDAPSRTLTLTSPAGRTKTTVFDQAGRVTQVTAGTLLPVTFAYTPQGQVATVQQGSRTTTFTYDSRGRVERVTDPLSRETLFAYDLADRVTTQTLPGVRIVGFGYDESGNVTAVTPPDRPAHGFTHTPVDLPDRYDPPSTTPGGPTTAAYRLDRTVETVTRPDGLTLAFGYDAAGRPATLTTPTGTTTKTYAPTTGVISALAAPDATVTLGYDGSLPTSMTWTGAVTGSVEVAYDSFFRPAGQTVNGGSSVAFTYDVDNYLTAAGALTITRQSATGLVTGTTLGTVTESRTLNAFGEVSGRTIGRSGTTLYDVSYTRDALARILTKTETVAGTTHVETYTYDPSGRLETVTRDGGLAASYGYDANGNRTSTTTGAGAIAATYDAQDHLQQWDATLYTYTAAGELLTKAEPAIGTTSYGYDVQGNLRQVSLPSGTMVQYQIDAINRRIGRSVNGVRTHGWLWAGTLRPVAELDGAGNVVSRFVYATGLNVPDYVVRGGQTYRLITDHLGSVRLVVDVATGSIVQQLDYDPWGRVMLDTNPGWQPFGFAGGLYDISTGLLRFGARDYDPTVGRWLAKDPAGFSGGDANHLSYVENDPINRVDPTGLDWIDSGLYYAANFSAGWGDTLTTIPLTNYSLTRELRNALPGIYGPNGGVDRCSATYKTGEWAGIAHSMALSAKGFGNLASRLGSQSARTRLYEIGQRTLSEAEYAKYGSIANPVRRGIAMIRDGASGAPSIKGLLTQAWKTVGTGLTPEAAAALGDIAAGFGGLAVGGTGLLNKATCDCP